MWLHEMILSCVWYTGSGIVAVVDISLVSFVWPCLPSRRRHGMHLVDEVNGNGCLLPPRRRCVLLTHAPRKPTKLLISLVLVVITSPSKQNIVLVWLDRIGHDFGKCWWCERTFTVLVRRLDCFGQRCVTVRGVCFASGALFGFTLCRDPQ